MTGPIDRVRIWNSYLTEAYSSAKKLHESNTASNYPPVMLAGGVLGPAEHYSLMTIMHSVLAIEARANHLIHELHEEGRISRSLRDAAARLRTNHKWFLLPRLAGRKKDLGLGTLPHQAISELCRHRNELIHVAFSRRILDRLPDERTVIRLYNNFVKAMEDMNVVLGRRSRVRKTVIDKLSVR